MSLSYCYYNILSVKNATTRAMFPLSGLIDNQKHAFPHVGKKHARGMVFLDSALC